MRAQLFIAVLGLSTLPVFASDQSAIEHFTEEVSTPPEVLDKLQLVDDFHLSLAEDTSVYAAVSTGGVELGAIVNLGKSIWSVIEKNAPVANTEYDFANALPAGVKSAASLSGFSDIQHKSIRMYGENAFGMKVYDITYTLVSQYGGSYLGQGKYLSTVAVIPSTVSVLIGYKLDLKVTNAAVVNVGTDKEPVGSVVLNVGLKIESPLKVIVKTVVYQFRGDTNQIKESK